MSNQDDPLALRSAALFRAFGWYLRWLFWREFHAVRIAGDAPSVPLDRPLIIYTNHPSWWDPALFMLLSNTILRDRPGFGPMEAAALRQYNLFRRLGVFGIETDRRHGAKRFIDVSLRILRDPANALWITAEGAFTDPRHRPVKLRPGLAHLARRAPRAAILPMAIEYPFWNERRPVALVRFGPPLEPDASHADRRRSVAEWTEMLERGLTETMDRLAEDALSRDPARFRGVLKGRAGIGGLYDIWRTGVALAGFRRPRLAHEPQREWDR